jgi:Flp pilus assembly protein TadG
VRLSKKNQRGVAILEFTFVSIILFTLIYGMLVYGAMIYDKTVLSNASREGVRAGIVSIVNNQGLTTAPTAATVSCAANTGITSNTFAEYTAQCVAYNALKNNLILFSAFPTFTFSNSSAFSSPGVSAYSTPSVTGACTASPPNQNCLLSVSIKLDFLGFYVFTGNKTLQATTSMYYE